MNKRLAIITIILCVIVSLVALVGCSPVKSKGNLVDRLYVPQSQGYGTQSDPFDMIDGKTNTAWTGNAESEDSVVYAVYAFKETTSFNRIILHEDGRNITGYNIYISSGNSNNPWTKIVSGGSLHELDSPGVINFDEVAADRIKIEITSSKGNFAIKEMGIYLEEINEQEDTDTKD